MHIAIVVQHESIAEYLIELGADVNSIDANGGSVLHSAVIGYRNQNGYFIEKLLSCGADIHKVNNHGVSPYSLAHSIANTDVRKYF